MKVAPSQYVVEDCESIDAPRPMVEGPRLVEGPLPRPFDLKICSYPFAYLTIIDTCDILFYCVCSACVWLLIYVTVFIQLMAAKQQ